ncbi:LysR family transcriptional regulator [Streptomonospora sediminis]
MDLDLRKMRYFAAVAEHRSFIRAAEELHISQPVLSRQIRALEQELKAQLFDRDNRGTRLTPAGEALAEDARALLPAADAARRRVRDLAAGRRTFTIGFSPGLVVAPAVRELSHRHPDLTVEVLQTGWLDQTDAIRNGRADVGYVRLPADQRGLAVEPLFTEARAVMLPDDHRLAGKETVSVTDLAAERLLQNPGDVPEWRDLALEQQGPQPHKPVPSLRSAEEKLEHVAAGTGIVVLPISAAALYNRPGIVHVPVHDIAPTRVCLAWDRSRSSALIREYAAIARSS